MVKSKMLNENKKWGDERKPGEFFKRVLFLKKKYTKSSE